jgi:hypothetical protein
MRVDAADVDMSVSVIVQDEGDGSIGVDLMDMIGACSALATFRRFLRRRKTCWPG